MRSVQEAVTCDVMSELGATGVSINEADCWLPNPRRPLMVVTKDPTLHPVTSGRARVRVENTGGVVPYRLSGSTSFLFKYSVNQSSASFPAVRAFWRQRR